MLTGGQLAALIVAVFWAILVCFLAVVLVRLTRVLTETSKIIAEMGERTPSLLDDMSQTISRANEQMTKVEAITANVERMTDDGAAMTTAVRSAFGGPLVKGSSFFAGIRRAIEARRERRAAKPVGRSRTGR